jgi:outer membrane murein-binding lipoprotein Lpp
VNIKEYIESGVLELYIYDQLSDAERIEVEGLCSKYPEIQAELDAIQHAVNGYAKSFSRNPDPALRTQVLSQIDLKGVPEPKVIPMNSSASGTYRWLAAASVALFIVSGAVNLYQYNKYQNISGQLSELQSKNTLLADNNVHLTKQISAVTDDLTVVSSSSNVKVELAGLPLSPTKYINTAELPPLAQEKQYQLWAIVDGKPVDLGVLPTEGKQTALIRVKDVSAPQAFAITIEPKGGSVNPTMDQMIVLGKL